MSVVAMTNFNYMDYELLRHLPYSLHLDPGDNILFPNLKTNFRSNDETISHTNAFLENLDKSNYWKREKNWRNI